MPVRSVCFEIDTPARWAWHIIRLAAGARTAPLTPPMSEAGASVFALPRASRYTRFETKPQKPCEAFARDAARRCFTNARARAPGEHPARAFTGRTGRQPLYHIAIEELQEWAYTGEPLVR